MSTINHAHFLLRLLLLLSHTTLSSGVLTTLTTDEDGTTRVFTPAKKPHHYDYECPSVQAALYDYLPQLSLIFSDPVVVNKSSSSNNSGNSTPFPCTKNSRLLLFTAEFIPLLLFTSENVLLDLDETDIPVPVYIVIQMVVYTLNNIIEAAGQNTSSSGLDQRSTHNVKHEEKKEKNHDERAAIVRQAFWHRNHIVQHFQSTFGDICHIIAPEYTLDDCVVFFYPGYVQGDDLTLEEVIARLPDNQKQRSLALALNETTKWLQSEDTIQEVESMDQDCAKKYWPSRFLPPSPTTTFTSHVAPLTVHHGVRVPIVGMGLGCSPFGEGCEEEGDSANHTNLVSFLQHAMRLGVRFFDTAQLYDNEEVLGDAWFKSGVNRSEFVFSTKLDDQKIPADVSSEMIRHHVRKSINMSLTKLRTSYVDFVHVHHWQHLMWPFLREGDDDNASPIDVAIQTLFELESEGVIRSVLHVGGVGIMREDELKWYKLHSILSRPFGGGTQHDAAVIQIKAIGIRQLVGHPDSIKASDFSHIKEIAKRVGRTGGQVIHRWSLQTGVGVIPCTGSIEHLRENSPDELLSFELDEEMMWRLNSMWRLMVPLK